MTEDRFAGIRPYNDAEVRPVIDRLLRNAGLLDAIARLRLPRLAKLFGAALRLPVRWTLAHQTRSIQSVHDFQALVERYMRRMVDATTTSFSVSGLERLDPSAPCLFIGNHRDIALDPAFLNFALWSNGVETARIAIGDNLLKRDYVADLMRLNKSFIVNRSARGPRQMLAAYQQLSAYISQSLHDEGSSVWIAQREGRAKDGWDRTEPAIIKMLCMAKPREQSFPDYIASLRLVPVAISYEWDPCDEAKANELHCRAETGGYVKSEHEDVASIARSITGQKGAVHVSFGQVLGADYNSPDEVAEEIDRQVLALYQIQPTNLCAFRLGEGRLPDGFEDQAELADAVEAEFRGKLAHLPESHRAHMIAMYANPVRNRDALLAGN